MIAGRFLCVPLGRKKASISAGWSLYSFGGGKRDRTADLLHAMQALSQLSYTPTEFDFFKWRPHGDSNPGYRRERAVS